MIEDVMQFQFIEFVDDHQAFKNLYYFLINFLMHIAAGESFLGLKPPKPLRVFYLQSEISYHYLRERIKKLQIPKDILHRGLKNFCATPQIESILNDLILTNECKMALFEYSNDTSTYFILYITFRELLCYI